MRSTRSVVKGTAVALSCALALSGCSLFTNRDGYMSISQTKSYYTTVAEQRIEKLLEILRTENAAGKKAMDDSVGRTNDGNVARSNLAPVVAHANALLSTNMKGMSYGQLWNYRVNILQTSDLLRTRTAEVEKEIAEWEALQKKDAGNVKKKNSTDKQRQALEDQIRKQQAEQQAREKAAQQAKERAEQLNQQAKDKAAEQARKEAAQKAKASAAQKTQQQKNTDEQWRRNMSARSKLTINLNSSEISVYPGTSIPSANSTKSAKVGEIVTINLTGKNSGTYFYKVESIQTVSPSQYGSRLNIPQDSAGRFLLVDTVKDSPTSPTTKTTPGASSTPLIRASTTITVLKVMTR